MKHKLRIFYLGPQNTFSHTAALAFSNIFCKNKGDFKLEATADFKELLEKPKQGELTVLPFENSITSDVHDTMDFIFNYGINLTIVGAISLKIALALYAVKGADLSEIKYAYSHPKALEQASSFLQQYNIIPTPATSTAQALYDIAEENDKTKVAIASKYITELPKNVVRLQENVANNQNNFTRFLLVGTHSTLEKIRSSFEGFKRNVKARDFKFSYVNEKFAFIARLKHEVGSLAKFLTLIAKNNGNLTKIQSRPIPGTFFEYDFLIELTADNIEKVAMVIADYLQSSRESGFEDAAPFAYKPLGIYPEFIVE